jgi:tetratricopeptide (TPR) repeat protein
MKAMLFFIFLFLWQGGGDGRLNRIAETNRLKKAAADAYLNERYSEAAALYEKLQAEWGEESDAVRLNRANALYRADNKEAAAEAYRQLIESRAGSAAKSKALQQLGYMASEEERLPDALQYFKEALKADHTNESARFNYELAWQRLNARKKPDEQPNQEQEKDKDDEQERIEPSEWAKQQKARADALVGQFRYADALKLMQQSYEKDSTIAAYGDFIRRLDDVVDIDQ